MNKMTFDAMQREAEDAEIAAVLATIQAPEQLELEPINDKPFAPQSRVTLNAIGTLP